MCGGGRVNKGCPSFLLSCLKEWGREPKKHHWLMLNHKLPNEYQSLSWLILYFLFLGKKTYFISGRAGTTDTPSGVTSGITSPVNTDNGTTLDIESQDKNHSSKHKSSKAGSNYSIVSGANKVGDEKSGLLSKPSKFNVPSLKFSQKKPSASGDKVNNLGDNMDSKSKSSFSLATKTYAKLSNNSNGKTNMTGGQSLGTVKLLNGATEENGDLLPLTKVWAFFLG